MKIVVGLLIVALVIIGAILSLPFLIDLNKYQDQFRPLIEDALNRKIQFQDIRLTVWPRIGARIAGLTVLDDPSFNAGPFASLESLDVGVKLLPLLSKKIEVEEIMLRHPAITVTTNKDGAMNVSTIGGKKQEPSAEAPPEVRSEPTGNPLQALALFAVDQVSIIGGNLTFRDHSTKPFTEYHIQNLDLHVRSVHLGHSPTIHLSTTIQPYNIPLTLDGSFGPLVETLEVKQYDFTIGIGKVALALKGALTAGTLDVTLSSPLITTTDLPVTLPLTKPVQIRNLMVVAKAPYPFKQGVPPLDLVDVPTLGLLVATGNSVVSLKGSVLGGQATVTVSAPSLNTADLPVAVPLAKPIEVKDLLVAIKTRVPFKPDAPPLELADISDLRLVIALGKSPMTVRGTVLGGQTSVTVSAPSLNTADLPVETGLPTPVELQDLELGASLKGQEARLANLSFRIFDGQTTAQATMSLRPAAPPFEAKVTIQGLQLGPALNAISPGTRISVSGTAAMDLSLAGKGFSAVELTNSLEGSGHLRARNGKIEGVNLMQEVMTLLRIAGVSPDSAKATVFSTIENDFAIRRGVVNVQRLIMDSHDFQTSGGGTIGFDQALNLAVHLNLSQSLSQKIAGSSPVVKLVVKEGRLRLPLRITGTIQNPSYALDLKDLAGNVQEQVQQKAKETVKELLEGAKSPRDLKQEGKDLLKGLFGR